MISTRDGAEVVWSTSWFPKTSLESLNNPTGYLGKISKRLWSEPMSSIVSFVLSGGMPSKCASGSSLSVTVKHETEMNYSPRPVFKTLVSLAYESDALNAVSMDLLVSPFQDWWWHCRSP
jgi:hypothetical protein